MLIKTSTPHNLPCLNYHGREQSGVSKELRLISPVHCYAKPWANHYESLRLCLARLLAVFGSCHERWSNMPNTRAQTAGTRSPPLRLPRRGRRVLYRTSCLYQRQPKVSTRVARSPLAERSDGPATRANAGERVEGCRELYCNSLSQPVETAHLCIVTVP